MIICILAIIFILILVLLLVVLVCYNTQPAHVQIEFNYKNIPVFAWLNSIKKDWEKSRIIVFPNGEKHRVKQASGQFLMVYDWKVPIKLDKNATQIEILIPKLTTTDFASIPRALMWLLTPIDNSIYAAIIHDYLYRNPKNKIANAISKADADRIFYWAMRAKGVHRMKAGLMYMAVHLFGNNSYTR
jgi:hypothetical protein